MALWQAGTHYARELWRLWKYVVHDRKCIDVVHSAASGYPQKVATITGRLGFLSDPSRDYHHDTALNRCFPI